MKRYSKSKAGFLAAGTGLLLFLLLLPPRILAAELELPGGTEIEIDVFGGPAGTTVLWLPSERGFGNAQRDHARELGELGYRVWLADLHNAYFVQPGRSSINQFPVDDIVAIIEAALDTSQDRLILMSGSRGAQLALIAAREWQLRNPGDSSIGGVVLAHAHLYDARPAPGDSAQYLPVVAATNLPVYLLVAQYSTKFSRLQELATELGEGGSSVYTQVLVGVQGGFHARDDSRLSDADRAAKQSFAGTLDRAIGMLQKLRPPTNAVAASHDTVRFGQESTSAPALTRIRQPWQAPSLRLAAFDGSEFSQNALRGKVLLVNFWASWCRPCVTEIPSLHRLDTRIEDVDFDIVTVNVGEDHSRVEQFLQKVPVELPVLMDYDASISKDWMIYVYPSSYLVDRQGKIRYAYLGALEWDSAENIGIIQRLLAER